MAAIKNIKLKNFKAFYGDETIELGGKHFLLYGENGSGKSSIYWALYTLLQSATKSPLEIQKYFTPNNDEHLINLDFLKEHPNFALDANGKIIAPQSIGRNASVTIELTNGQSATIDSTGKTDIEGILEGLNQYSDFISHRLLINFYNFRNSKEINLWEVFVRDVFPFVMDNSGNGTKNLSQLLKDIETNKPYKLYPNNRTYKISRSLAWQERYNSQISDFNKEVNYWLSEINRNISVFYNEYLKQRDEPELRINLKYQEELKFSKFKPQYYKKDEIEYVRWSNLADLNNPLITIKIEQKNKDGSFTDIHRPQSFLNEARLTSIALSVRFSLLDASIRPEYNGQFLALDDLLISLDMANRDKVLDIILKKFAPKYKIYLFTHERTFFNLVNQRLTLLNIKENWIIKEMYMNSITLPQRPKLVDNSDYISKANQALNNFDLPGCAILLRKECEQNLKRLLPINLSVTYTKEGTVNYKQLNDLIVAFSKFYKEKLSQNDDRYAKLNQYKTFILNPLSHDNLESEYYFNELKDAIDLLLDLRKIKIINKIDSDTKLFYKQIAYDGTEWSYEIILRENLLVYQLPDSSINIPNVKCTALSRTNGNKNETFCKDYKLKDFPKMAYRNCNQGRNPENPINYLEVLVDENHITLKDRLLEL